MKYVILHAEGMSDHPRQELAGKTPLQAASTPHLDRLAEQSELGSAHGRSGQWPSWQRADRDIHPRVRAQKILSGAGTIGSG